MHACWLLPGLAHITEQNSLRHREEAVPAQQVGNEQFEDVLRQASPAGIADWQARPMHIPAFCQLHVHVTYQQEAYFSCFTGFVSQKLVCCLLPDHRQAGAWCIEAELHADMHCPELRHHGYLGRARDKAYT